MAQSVPARASPGLRLRLLMAPTIEMTTNSAMTFTSTGHTLSPIGAKADKRMTRTVVASQGPSPCPCAGPMLRAPGKS